MTNREDFYLRLPVWLQNVVCSLEGLRIRNGRYADGFRDLLIEAEERALWSANEIAEYRDALIRKMTMYCANTIPYYKRMFRRIGIAPEDIRNLSDLSALPLLTKDEVRRSTQDINSPAVSSKNRIAVHTSGTTGAGLRFFTTHSAIQQQWAIWWRYRRAHGLNMGEWCAYFGGRSVVPMTQERPPFWRLNYPGKQVLFSGYHISTKNLPYYIDEIRKRQVEWLHGYPSLLSLLSSFVLDKGIEMNKQIRWITTGAENLFPHQADLIEQAFGVRPKQHYGMAEAVANISECRLGNLHVDEDFSAVEFVPFDVGASRSFRIVGSNLTNYANPLLRYDTGDIAVLSEKKCGCGWPGRMVERIDGRNEDYVLLRNGVRIGRMDHVFKDMTSIREAQICQKFAGEVLLRVVRGAEYSREDEDQLLREMHKRTGDDMKVFVEYVDKIERPANGKLRFVVSEIADGQI